MKIFFFLLAVFLFSNCTSMEEPVLNSSDTQNLSVDSILNPKLVECEMRYECPKGRYNETPKLP